MTVFLLSVLAILIASVLVVGVARGIREGRHSRAADPTARMCSLIADKIDGDFRSIGWGAWDKSIHHADGQIERIERAATDTELCVLNYDEHSKTATIKGSGGDIYTVSKDGCSCADFRKRGLPCKHMYLLAMTLTDK